MGDVGVAGGCTVGGRGGLHSGGPLAPAFHVRQPSPRSPSVVDRPMRRGRNRAVRVVPDLPSSRRPRPLARRPRRAPPGVKARGGAVPPEGG